MTKTETSIISTYVKNEDSYFICCRLIRTVDGFRGEDVFSVFLTSGTMEAFEEDFVYDITRDERDALAIFHLLCDGNVTTCTLREVLHDLLAER